MRCFYPSSSYVLNPSSCNHPSLPASLLRETALTHPLPYTRSTDIEETVITLMNREVIVDETLAPWNTRAAPIIIRHHDTGQRIEFVPIMKGDTLKALHI